MTAGLTARHWERPAISIRRGRNPPLLRASQGVRVDN